MEVYKVLGVMSGTSLDGLDVAYCEFVKADEWEFKIHDCITIPYSPKRINLLKEAIHFRGEHLTALDAKFGQYIGRECKVFIDHHKLEADLISSHGHTIFHQPQHKFTLQIGSGAHIHACTDLPVVCDFRTQDVALGGQGAPLVPIGDELLFGNFGACLNLGGFANISAQVHNKRIAWDIGAVNVVLNPLANKEGHAFDNGGEMAAKGSLHQELLNELDALDFYKQQSPKSLGIEWVQKHINHLLEKYPVPVFDVIHTYTVHIAKQIASTINKLNKNSVLVTGGGAYNRFLINTIKQYTNSAIIIPDDKIIQYKEALIFAFLGVLKWRGENNVLSSVTGAKRDHSSGVVYGRI